MEIKASKSLKSKAKAFRHAIKILLSLLSVVFVELATAGDTEVAMDFFQPQAKDQRACSDFVRLQNEHQQQDEGNPSDEQIAFRMKYLDAQGSFRDSFHREYIELSYKYAPIMNTSLFYSSLVLALKSFGVKSPEKITQTVLSVRYMSPAEQEKLINKMLHYLSLRLDQNEFKLYSSSDVLGKFSAREFYAFYVRWKQARQDSYAEIKRAMILNFYVYDALVAKRTVEHIDYTKKLFASLKKEKNPIVRYLKVKPVPIDELLEGKTGGVDNADFDKILANLHSVYVYLFLEENIRHLSLYQLAEIREKKQDLPPRLIELADKRLEKLLPARTVYNQLNSYRFLESQLKSNIQDLKTQEQAQNKSVNTKEFQKDLEKINYINSSSNRNRHIVIGGVSYLTWSSSSKYYPIFQAVKVIIEKFNSPFDSDKFFQIAEKAIFLSQGFPAHVDYALQIYRALQAQSKKLNLSKKQISYLNTLLLQNLKRIYGTSAVEGNLKLSEEFQEDRWGLEQGESSSSQSNGESGNTLLGLMKRLQDLQQQDIPALEKELDTKKQQLEEEEAELQLLPAHSMKEKASR